MWFDPLTAWVVSLFTTGGAFAKEKIGQAFEPTIPTENWANKDLIHKDRMSGMSEKQIMQNVQNGKYIIREKYPEPHRDPKSGKIIIENCDLYNADVKNFGAYQAYKWVQQGKYNLSPEELKKQEEAHKKRMEELYKLV